MKNESVAILDIRSDELTFLIGSNGINGTFVFRGSKTVEFDGYTSSEGFFDPDGFSKALREAAKDVLQKYRGKIEKIYVGVPSAFMKVHTTSQTIAFSSKRRITKQEIEALYESGLSDVIAFGRYIHHSAMYFSVGNERRIFSETDLANYSSSVLKGGLSYYYATDAFVSTLESALKEYGFSKIRYYPTSLAEALYLLPKTDREGYAFLLDVGVLSSTVSVVYGNAIVHEQCFETGLGKIIVDLMEGLSVDYEKAVEILENADISGGLVDKGLKWTDSDGNEYYVETVNEIIKCGLDLLCEKVDGFFERYYKDKNLPAFSDKYLAVTGEGVERIKGATEHISKRLGRIAKSVQPDVPYYDKPTYSSRISLLYVAVAKDGKTGLKEKIKRFFGGKKNV